MIEKVLAIAAEHLGMEVNALGPKMLIESLFHDSLEYLDFTLQLQQLGNLSEEDIGRSETLEDLANAIVHPS